MLTNIGIGGIQYCAMKEDLESAKSLTDLSYTQTKIADYSNSIRHPRFDINFSTKYNQELIDAYQSRIIPKRRKQRMLPNIIGKESFFQKHTLKIKNSFSKK